jgi:hypothetical protein
VERVHHLERGGGEEDEEDFEHGNQNPDGGLRFVSWPKDAFSRSLF